MERRLRKDVGGDREHGRLEILLLGGAEPLLVERPDLLRRLEAPCDKVQGGAPVDFAEASLDFGLERGVLIEER